MRRTKSGHDGGSSKRLKQTDVVGHQDEPLEEIASFHHANGDGLAITNLIQLKDPLKKPNIDAPILSVKPNKNSDSIELVGNVTQIFGAVNDCFLVIKMKGGVRATLYSPGDKFYIHPKHLSPFNELFE